MVKKYLKQDDPMYNSGKAYPFFAMFDTNKDKVITENEFLSSDLMNQSRGYATYDHFYSFFQKNAAAICHDPRPQPYGSSSDSDSDMSDYDGFFGPLSKVWFAFDTNKDGLISSNDVATAFDTWNID